MPYSINGSQTRIYTGTTPIFLTINVNTRTLFCINAKPMGAISLAIDVKRTLTQILSTPNQWAQSH